MSSVNCNSDVPAGSECVLQNVNVSWLDAGHCLVWGWVGGVFGGLQRFVRPSECENFAVLVRQLVWQKCRACSVSSWCRPGLANFNPQEGHMICKGWPDCRTCVYIQGAEGILNRTLLFTNNNICFYSVTLNASNVLWAVRTDFVSILRSSSFSAVANEAWERRQNRGMR